MGAFADYFATQAPAEEPAAPVEESPGQFGRGLRSGLSGAYSQLQGAAGGVAEAAGFPEVAAGRFEAMRSAQADAEANAPRVGSYKDVHGVRDAFDYVTGLVGGSIPQSVVAVGGALAGRTPLGRAIGATLATTPFEAGDIAQRQQNDPVAMQASAGERLRDQLVGGGAAAAVQSVLPTMVAGKMAAPVLGAERVGVRQALREGLREAPAALAIEGGTEAGGELAKQLAHRQGNQALPIDTDQLLEAGIGGVAAGGGMHGAGVAVQAGKAALASPANTLVDGAKAVGDAAVSGVRAIGAKASSAADSAGTALSDAGEKVGLPDPVEALKGIYDKGTQSARAFWESVAGGEDTATLMGKAGRTAEQIKEALPTIDAERLQKVSQAAQDLWANKGLTEPQRAQLGEAMKNLGDKANQQFVATLKLGADQGGKLAKSSKSLFDSFMSKVKDKVPGGTKKSEDFSGVEQGIKAEVLPKLQEIYPNLMTEPETLQHVASGLRMAIQGMREGGLQGLSSTQVASLWDTFGDHTADILHSVQRALGTVKPQEQENFYGALNEMRAQRREQDKTLGLMQRSLLPELQDTTRTSELRDELRVLRQAVEKLDTSTQQGKFQWETLKFDLDTRYGSNADKILAAIEREHAGKSSILNGVASEEDRSELKGAEHMSERAVPKFGDAVYYGPEKGGLALHPKLDPNGDKGQAAQAAERARKQNPDRHIRFLTAQQLGEDNPAVQQHLKSLQAAGMSSTEAKAELKKYGMTVAEGQRDAGQITKDDLKLILVKDVEGVGRSKYNQPSVFKVDNTAYDAIAMTKLIERQFKDEFNEADDRGQINRNARMFLTAVAALQDHLGKSFELDPKLVIDHQGTTVAAIRKLDLTPQMKGEGGEHTTADALIDEGRRLRTTLNALQEKLDAAEPDTQRYITLQGRVDALEEKLAKIEERWRKVDRAERIQRVIDDSGRYEADPRGPIHEQANPEPLRTNETGNSQAADARHKNTPVSEKRGKPTPDEETVARSGPVKTGKDFLREKFQKWVDAPPSAAAKAVGEKGLQLVEVYGKMNPKEQKGLNALLSEGTKPSQVAGTVSALHKKYAGGETKAEPAAKPAEKPAADTGAIDQAFAKESYPQFETDKEAAKFLLQAYKRFGELAAEERRIINDPDHPEGALPQEKHDALFRLASFFAGDSYADLGSFLPTWRGESEKDTELRAWLKKAAPEVAANLPKSFASLQGTGTQRVSSAQMQAVRAYVDKVLGPQVRTTLANILHAGEYNPTHDAIRVSVHALNPQSVAYHEALHAFVAKLMTQGNEDVVKVLRTVAMSEPVLRQLRTLLANERAALAQLSDPEEAAAYMYQFWAAGQLKVGDRTRNVFERIKEALAKVFGILTADARAEKILDYFHSGEFKTQGLGQPNAVTRALVESGRNQVIEQARALTEPLTKVVDAIGTAGGQRLRDTGIPALRELADMMKATSRGDTTDPGYLPASRIERTRVMNELGQQLRGYTEAQMQEALEAMQANDGRTVSPQARIVMRIVQGPAPNALLPRMLAYMKAAGVDISKVQPRPDYFPRLYDAHYISRHQREFQTVLENHGIGQVEARDITQRLVAADGAEFTVERDRPGMQFAKTRKLAMIPDAQLAPFMRKNMLEIMSAYVTQATRRAEWARRFGDDGMQIERLKTQAQAQGATPEQIQTAEKFVRAVDGTLGDTLSPGARRVMGNMIVYQNWRLLPLAIFSSVIDPLGIVVRGGTAGDAFKTFMRGMREIPASWRGSFTPDAQTNLAETLGVIDDAMLTATTGQLYTQGLVGDTARKINDVLFRFNLMEGFNRSMRVGAAQAAIAFLNRHRDGTASPHSARWLRELGLAPGFTMDVNDPAVRAAINMWVDGAVLRPDAVDKPIWMNDPHWMLISHLKQFVYSFQETILKRVWHEYVQGNYAPAMALASYVPVMIASDAIKAMLQGGGDVPEWKKDWGPAEYLGSGIERAGILGKLQFPIDGPGMLAGPTAQQALAVAEALDGKASPSHIALKAMPANVLYADWLGAGGSRVENNMSVD